MSSCQSAITQETDHDTISLDLEGSADQGEERGVEGHHPVAVERHVHGHQALGDTNTSCYSTSAFQNQNQVPAARWLVGGSSYLTGDSVRTELPKTQRRLDPPEQSHYVQVFDTTSDTERRSQ